MPPQSSYGVAFRDPQALERVLGAVAKRPRRAKQLTLGLRGAPARSSVSCLCERLLPRGKCDCPKCGAFLCKGCDVMTTRNGGSEGWCLECLVVGREADPRTLELAAAE